MQNETLVTRFESLKNSVEGELQEIDIEIMGVESLQDSRWKNWTGQAVAEKKQEILKEKVAWKLRTRERLQGKARDFTQSLVNERAGRVYPLRYSATPADNRKSEALDLRAKAFLEVIKGDVDRLKTEWESAPEREYLSHLVYWAGVLNTFDGHPESAGAFTKLRQEWEEALGLPDLDELIRRSKSLEARLREWYLKTELGFITPPKTLEEFMRQGEALERAQAQADAENSGAVGVKYDTRNPLIPRLH